MAKHVTYAVKLERAAGMISDYYLRNMPQPQPVIVTEGFFTFHERRPAQLEAGLRPWNYFPLESFSGETLLEITKEYQLQRPIAEPLLITPETQAGTITTIFCLLGASDRAATDTDMCGKTRRISYPPDSAKWSRPLREQPSSGTKGSASW